MWLKDIDACLKLLLTDCRTEAQSKRTGWIRWLPRVNTSAQAAQSST